MPELNSAAGTLLNCVKDHTKEVFGIFEFESQPGDAQWLELPGQRAKIDEIFFRGNKEICATALLQEQQPVDIRLGVAVMVGQGYFACSLLPDALYCGKELGGPGNGTENDGLACRRRQLDHALCPESTGAKLGRIGAAEKHDRVSAAQRARTLAQPAGGQQFTGQVCLRQKDEIKVAMQAAVLKAIIEQMQAGIELSFRQQPGLVTAGAHHYGDLQLARDQQRLVTELLGGAAGINDGNLRRLAAVTAREHVETDSAFFQQFAQCNHAWSFAAATHGNVSYADDRARQLVHLENSTVVQSVPQCHTGAEDQR